MYLGPAEPDFACADDPEAFADPPGLREWAYGLGGAAGLGLCVAVWLLAAPFALVAFGLTRLTPRRPNERLRRAPARG